MKTWKPGDTGYYIDEDPYHGLNVLEFKIQSTAASLVHPGPLFETSLEAIDDHIAFIGRKITNLEKRLLSAKSWRFNNTPLDDGTRQLKFSDIPEEGQS